MMMMMMMMMIVIKTLILLLAGAAFYDGSVMAAPKDGEVTFSRDLGFFARLNQKRRNKTKDRLECVYGHPVKGKFCPPVMDDPMAHLKEPPTIGGEGNPFEKLTNGVYRLVDEDSSLAVFSRCLDDPDSDGCRELQVGGLSPSSQVAHAPGHLRNLGLATLSPTIDDCGGNMFDPRFCASQMPSTSAAPTEEGDGGDKPSQARVVGTTDDTGAPTTGSYVPPGPDGGEAGAPSQDPGVVPPGPDQSETRVPSTDPATGSPTAGPSAGPTTGPSAGKYPFRIVRQYRPVSVLIFPRFVPLAVVSRIKDRTNDGTNR